MCHRQRICNEKTCQIHFTVEVNGEPRNGIELISFAVTSTMKLIFHFRIENALKRDSSYVTVNRWLPSSYTKSLGEAFNIQLILLLNLWWRIGHKWMGQRISLWFGYEWNRRRLEIKVHSVTCSVRWEAIGVHVMRYSHKSKQITDVRNLKSAKLINTLTSAVVAMTLLVSQVAHRRSFS